ncbi:hypothetical protein KPH14_010129 [Odynerus spinipes]|uniref:Uncharacterized protein n=1 Tax=Odynerus spinipes TaxID=1348599 RepID=A0AAD9RUG8_9HYME|nr:hypothetical protein KPH14_010129 [Odynerus spinipes]
MAPRRNAKQADAEPVEKAAEAGDVSPPKRTKMIKPSSVKLEQLKDTRLTRSTKTRKAEQSEVVEAESEPVKKSRARNKVAPTKTTVPAPQEETTKSKRIVKKGKTTEENSSPGDLNAVTESENSVPQKLPAKKTRGKAVTEKAGTTDSVEEAEVKPKTRAKKTTTPKDIDIEVPPTKGRKAQKNVGETVSKETKTKAKALKKDTEESEAAPMEVKKKTTAKTKTAENNVSKEELTANEGKKTKAPATKKARNQTDNAENNVGESNELKPIRGRQKKAKDSSATTNAPKKGRGKKETVAVVKNQEEKESESTAISSEEEKETESVATMKIMPRQMNNEKVWRKRKLLS